MSGAVGERKSLLDGGNTTYTELPALNSENNRQGDAFKVDRDIDITKLGLNIRRFASVKSDMEDDNEKFEQAKKKTAPVVNADQASFVRRSDKYWVRNGDTPILKAFIDSHIKKAREGLIQSVYLDSDDFEMYNDRLNADEGASLVRLRWYGEKFPPKDVYVERKTHHETHLTTAVSEKERFVVPSRDVSQLLNYRLDTIRVKTDAGLDHLPDEVITKLRGIQARPKIRTEYWRTAWEDPAEPRYRISLDEYVSYFKDIDMLKSGWEPLDKTGNYAFWAFPFAILEVKVDLGAAAAASSAGPAPGLSREMGLLEAPWEPDWVTRAREQRLILETDKYSKFLSSVAYHFTDSVARVPEYMDTLMEVEADAVATGAKPTVMGMKLRKKDLVKRNLQVEPKTWMALERTFIKWVQLAGLLFAAAMFLEEKSVGRGHKVVSRILLVTTMLIIIYAYLVYLWRVHLLKTKTLGLWQDHFGPFGVAFLLVLSAMYIFVDRLVDDSSSAL